MLQKALASVAAAALGFAAASASDDTVVFRASAAHACFEHAALQRAHYRAFEDCDAALEFESLARRDRAATLVNRGIVKFHSGDDFGAIEDFQEANRISPSLVEPHANAVLVHIRRDDWASAIEAVDAALAIDPSGSAQLFYRRGWAYEAIGDWEQAIEDYRRAVEINPDWSLAKSDLYRLERKNAAHGS